AGVVRVGPHGGGHRQRVRRSLRRPEDAEVSGPPDTPTGPGTPTGPDSPGSPGSSGSPGSPGTVAWFHCFPGIAGDMALGALVDAGADIDEVRGVLSHLPVDGWAIEAEPVLRCGIAATRVHVHAPEDGVVRTAAHITGMIEQADLPVRVARRALAA